MFIKKHSFNLVMKKRIIVILDGVSDLPCKELGNKTPLEAAKTPNLDFYATNGKSGTMWPIKKGIAPESDQSMISLLGFDPFKAYTGRGILEAYGFGINFKDKIVARCNFSQIKKGYITKVQGAEENEMWKLAKLVSTDKVKIIPTIGYRAVMLIEGNSSPHVTNTHPGYKIINNYVSTAQKIAGKKIKEKKCIALEKDAIPTAKIINEFVASAKMNIEGKTILVRGVSNKLPKLGKLKGRWALIADMPVEKAIGKLTGMEILPKPKDLEKTFHVLRRNFDKFDNFYLQIKGPDTFGHLGDPLKKKEAIELIDREFISRLKELDFSLVCITADHSTPCSFKAHSNHPVPVLIYGKGSDGTRRLTEKEARKGSLGKFSGRALLKKI